MQVLELSIEELEVISDATFQQLLAKRGEHEKAKHLIGTTHWYSLDAYLMQISRMGHEINDLRDIIKKLDEIIYNHNNQIK